MGELLNFILIAGIVINTILLGLLYKSEVVDQPKKWLIVFFILTLFVFVHFYAQFQELLLIYVISFIPNEVVEWLAGPVILFYIRSLFGRKLIWKSKDIFHFVPPFLILFFIAIPFLISLLLGDAVFSYLKTIQTYSSIYVIIRDLVLLTYIFYSLYFFQKMINSVSEYYSDSREQEYSWIRYFLWGIIFVMFIDVGTEFYEILIGEIFFETAYLSVGSLIVLISYLGYYGVNKSSLLLPDFLWKKSFKEAKSLSTVLSNDEQDFFEKLQELMVKEEVFKDENLTLGTLASKLDCTDKQMSFFLNKRLETNFYQFINKHRTELFINKIQDKEYENYTIFGVAQICGFKSKTTFNRFFKKEYSCSPSEYKNAQILKKDVPIEAVAPHK